MKYIEAVVMALVHSGARSATKFVSPTEVVRATRQLVRGKVPRGNVYVILTMGKPNYNERQFVKACKKAGEPFPVKKIQLKALPKRKK